jgi:hypothetical protein
MASGVMVAVINIVAFDRFDKFVRGNMESSIKKTNAFNTREGERYN